MTYSDFINSLVAPIHTFFDCFSTLISSFLSNYIVITIFGLALFIGFFCAIKSFIFGFLHKHSNIDELADKKRG